MCLQGELANHAIGPWFVGMIARHLIEKLCHSHPFRYAESWMVLPGSTSLLYKQIQLGLHPTHVHNVMTWQCCNFLGWWWSMVTREFCNRMTYFFICSQLRVHFQTWWWCHRPILWYIKMILAKLGVVGVEGINLFNRYLPTKLFGFIFAFKQFKLFWNEWEREGGRYNESRRDHTDDESMKL